MVFRVAVKYIAVLRVLVKYTTVLRLLVRYITVLRVLLRYITVLRNLSGNTRPQSSHLAEPLYRLNFSLSGTDALVLISTQKKKKKCRRAMIRRTFPHNPHMRGKSYTHTYAHTLARARAHTHTLL